MTWVVEERIPPVPRRKPRRRRRAQRRKRGTQDAAATSATQAGHAKSKRGGGTSAIGPRKGRAGQASGPPVDRWTVALGRVRAALDRADGWQVWIDAEPGRTAADLARKEELSRARVCQVLKLRRLSREVVDDIRRDGRSGPVPGEADLRRVAGLPVREQWERYAEMVDELRAAKRRGPAMPRTDYRFDLRRARVWRAELEAEDRLTLADIARREGYTSGRVSQVLNLLELAPEILAVLDVEEDKLPKGLLRKEVRRIAWMREHEEQRAEFERLWPGVLGTSGAET